LGSLKKLKKLSSLFKAPSVTTYLSGRSKTMCIVVNSLSHSFSLSFSPSLSLLLSLSPSFYPSFFLTLSISVSLFLYPTVSLSLCLSVSFALSLSCSCSLSLSLSLFVDHLQSSYHRHLLPPEPHPLDGVRPEDVKLHVQGDEAKGLRRRGGGLE
jgi:hypothetical protein